MAPIVATARIFLSILAVILAVVSSIAWSRRRRAPEARYVSLLVASAAIYCFGYSGEIAQTTVSSAMFWLHVEYLGIPWIPALWVLLARKHKGLRSNLPLILAIPVVVLLGQWTNAWHGLYDRAMWMTQRGPFSVVSVDRGPIAWLNEAYLFTAMPYGAWVILSRWRSLSRRSRIQTLILAGAGLVPFFGYAIYLFGLSPWGLDLAPVMLAASAILTHFAVFRFQLFDLVPTAHSLVFNSMHEAALVTDLSYRLVDFNPAAAALFPGLSAAQPGDDASLVLHELPPPNELFNARDGACEIQLHVRGEVQYFELRVFPLQVDGQLLGWTTIIANMTAQRRLLNDLRRDAETDELTRVANRRSFIAAVERESARSTRSHKPFTLMFIDLDHFKQINDRYGHAAGDKALHTLAGRILECLRSSDLLGRFGGDEFATLLPETGPDVALEVAERIRNVAQSSPIDYDGQIIHARISVGLATADPTSIADWNRVLVRADQALYEAKNRGRNCVAAWPVTQVASEPGDDTGS